MLKKIIIISTLLLVAVSINLYGKCNQCYTFTKTPYSYSLKVYCTSQLPVDSLFSFLFDTSSVKELNSAYDSIFINSIEKNSYSITTYFHYLTYKGYSVYTKTAFRGNDSISITLVNFTHNWTSFPKPVKAEIHFKIKHEMKYNIIEYAQNITVDKKIGWVETKMLKWQFDKYTKHLCNVVQSIGNR